ncbi:dipeptidase [Microscilla marina]|uniref:Renal dipeptidase superfamily n=1 Tax=Microscilla marina ATCC 23134 TaxID=313606 RepID=A2A095_MICM2|nr:membrane dipeptidase [Microscilla marina]EAY23938.1 renal dipeptidase superfamily [Microscilla marina ATCC 23134]
MPTRFYWVLLLFYSHVQAQPPQGFADIHNSALYRLFAQADVQGLARRRYPVHLRAMRQLNTRLMVFSMGIPRFSMAHPDTVTIAQVLTFLKQFKAHIRQHCPQWQFVDQPNTRPHKMRWMLALEGTHLLKGELHWVDSLYNVGVRMVGIGHWFHNHFLVAPHDPHYQNQVPTLINDHTVLSPKGRQLVERLIARNIWLDVSHLRRQAFAQVVAQNQGRTPLIASHANAHAVCPVARNLSPAQIRAIAASKGLVGVCFHSPLIAPKPAQASIKQLVDHLAYLIQTAGYLHVAIGSDLEGLIRPPKGLKKLIQVKKIAREMQRRGFSPKVIEAVMWRNALRVLGGGER